MLLWFRNDLRTHDNPALHHFLISSDPVQPSKAIFFVSEAQWQAHDWSAIKIDFIIRHAEALKKELLTFNVILDIVHVADFNEQVSYLINYCQAHGVKSVFANSEVEVNEKSRDETCTAQGVPLTLFEADVIVPKGKILNKTGSMYKVFTPFKRAWLAYVKTFGFDYLGKPTPTKGVVSAKVNQTENRVHLSKNWPLANYFEQNTLATFYKEKLSDYENVRDIPSIKGTSAISPYLAAGAISPRYILVCLLNRCPDILLATDSAEFSWLNEIIWREFYRHLMFHEQRLCKHQCFNNKYKDVRWPEQDLLFTAWCEGRTGYPLVDAAMRQLNQTGWMHNRLRMVVASFLTKHLLIDWRKGEQYFMHQLIDGDLASNNGGWQWAASTGCDAQPYFRIFNPIRQSERFDPDGTFIRKYLPELKNVPDKKIHFPHAYINDHNLNIYWSAIVEHKTARLNALAFYK